MSKYIIKNCPACYLYGNKYGCEDNHDKQDRDTYCELITDCTMKQIVELCRETCRKRCTNDCLGTKKHCGYGQILQLLDIQEVE